MFYKKRILSLLFMIALSSTFTNSAFAANVNYLEKGNNLFQSYLISKDTHELEDAYLNYLKASQTSPSVSSFLGLGKVFMEKNMYPRAKIYLYKAYNIDKNNADLNYHLAKFWFKNNELVKALDFYVKAIELGLADNYDINLKLAVIYGKVGDFESAKKYYTIAQNLNPATENFKNNIQYLDNLDTNKLKYLKDTEQDFDLN